jgi:hypothetical protein
VAAVAVDPGCSRGGWTRADGFVPSVCAGGRVINAVGSRLERDVGNSLLIPAAGLLYGSAMFDGIDLELRRG